MNAYKNLSEMQTAVINEVFAFIQCEYAEKELKDEDFQNDAYEQLCEEAESFASNCGIMWAKKEVERYGTYKALKLADNHGYAIPLCNQEEDQFYKHLLEIILRFDDVTYDTVTSIDSYREYCDTNPLD